MTSSRARTSLRERTRAAAQIEPAHDSLGTLLSEREESHDRLAKIEVDIRRREDEVRRLVSSIPFRDFSAQEVLWTIESDDEWLVLHRARVGLEDELGVLEQRIRDVRESARAEWFTRARELRKPHIGRITSLHGAYADIRNPENPFALDPTFEWNSARVPKHFEQQQWKYATVTSSGRVIKARTRVGLTALAETLNELEPFMAEYGLHPNFTHVYEQRGNRRMAGYCSILVQSGGVYTAITGKKQEILPPTVALSSDQSESDRVYTAIHEFAHVNGKDDHEPHGRAFRQRFGNYLKAYLSGVTARFKSQVHECIAEDTYAPPVMDSEEAA